MQTHQEHSSPTSLTLTLHCVEGPSTVLLRGELDYSTTATFGAIVQGILATGHREILVDLDGVTFLDGAALGALIEASDVTHRAGGTLLVSEHAACLRLLQLTGEAHRLHLYDPPAPGGRRPATPPHHPVDTSTAAEREIEGLRAALETRTVIGQATGLAMARYGLDAERAFALLVRLSSHSNTKLRDVAHEFVRTRCLPDSASRDELRTQRLRSSR